MRTYKFVFEVEARVVVPEQFVDARLEEAAAKDTTPFLAQLYSTYQAADRSTPELEDKARDEFVLGLLKNGLRKELRAHVLDTCVASGLGATVAPVNVPVHEYVIPAGEDEEGSQS